MEILKILYLYGFGAFFVLWFVLYSKWQFIDEDDGPTYTKADKAWHFYGAAMRVTVFFAVGCGFIMSMYLPGCVNLLHIPVVGFLLLFEWDMLLNKVRRKSLFYISDKGWNKALGKKKWLYYSIGLIVSLICLFIFKI